MQITPDQFLSILKEDKTLSKSILDIEDKIERIISNQPPVFFGQYTDHGINHFRDTLKMALHLVCVDEAERKQDQKAAVDLSPLNVFILSAAVLFHDLGMHIHFNGFKQLINGFYDDVRVEHFNDLTWKEEWGNFMIEAKRFSGRERINLFGDEQATIKDIDFSKNTVDSDIQKQLIGEFIRRHHGRLAHEIALKGFPVKDNEVITFASDIQPEYKDIFGLIARSHSMNVRDAMEYIGEMFPDDPHFPYSIEVPFLMCVLRIADYFQFDSIRSNAILIKLRSFTSPFSLNEHLAHLATEYFKTDDRDPETLYVDAKPKDGLMYTKLLRLFDDIQKELDTSFAIIGEMYGRHKTHFRLRYRRLKSNLKNRKVIAKYLYVPDVYRFEADTDLFKLLVGPLYGYDPTFGVREMIQNAVDACVELKHKLGNSYEPVITVSIENKEDKEYIFTISDNGKGMSLAEIKNYYLKAGASFRNSTEWKMDYQKDDNTPAIQRTGKFGIGVLASFLLGDSIEVTTKRYNEPIGYTFNADLNSEFIEVRKNANCNAGTTISIKIKKETYVSFVKKREKSLSDWYILSSPKINYYIDNKLVSIDSSTLITFEAGKQTFKNAMTLDHEDFDEILWTYEREQGIAVNGVIIPNSSYYGSSNKVSRLPFVSIIDRHNRINLELNRNTIRGELPFINQLIEQCMLDFLGSLLLYNAPIKNNILNFKEALPADDEYGFYFPSKQFNSIKLLITTEGFFINSLFYKPILKEIDNYILFTIDPNAEITLLPNSVCSLFKIRKNNFNFPKNEKRLFMSAVTTELYLNNNYGKTGITDLVREDLKLLDNDKDYFIFSNSEKKADKKQQLVEMLKLNKLDAIQLVGNLINMDRNLVSILIKHLIEPVIIPHDWDKRKKYFKTLSPELIKYITEKRGIKL